MGNYLVVLLLNDSFFPHKTVKYAIFLPVIRMIKSKTISYVHEIFYYNLIGRVS
jgi:hypothetical protein